MDEQRRARPGIPFGRVAGVPVFLTGSWLVLAAGLTLTYGTYLSVRLPAPLGYVVGGGLVVGLTVSVLLHEMGHALVARHYGMGVRGITLNLRGGYTELAGEAPSPRVEVAVSLAGPAGAFAPRLLAGGPPPGPPGGTPAPNPPGPPALPHPPGGRFQRPPRVA